MYIYTRTFNNARILNPCDGDVDCDVIRMISSPHQINSDRSITLINTDIPCLKLYGNHWSYNGEIRKLIVIVDNTLCTVSVYNTTEFVSRTSALICGSTFPYLITSLNTSHPLPLTITYTVLLTRTNKHCLKWQVA